MVYLRRFLDRKRFFSAFWTCFGWFLKSFAVLFGCFYERIFAVFSLVLLGFYLDLLRFYLGFIEILRRFFACFTPAFVTVFCLLFCRFSLGGAGNFHLIFFLVAGGFSLDFASCTGGSLPDFPPCRRRIFRPIFGEFFARSPPPTRGGYWPIFAHLRGAAFDRFSPTCEGRLLIDFLLSTRGGYWPIFAPCSGLIFYPIFTSFLTYCPKIYIHYLIEM